MSDDTEIPVETTKPNKPRRRGGSLAAIAIIVAVLALAVAAWSTWQLTRARHADSAARQQVAAQVADLHAQIAAGGKQAQTSNQRLDAMESDIDGLNAGVKGLGLRTTNVETALTNLSGQQQSAQDTVLLNDVEMLLRTGQQRFELFHDSTGALKAYTQAIAVLSQVRNPAYAPVRVSVVTEHDALAAAAPPSRQSTLDTLSALRSEVASLPLVSAEATPAKPAAKRGFWSRLGHSFSGIVRITHESDDSHPVPVDAGFARQALALDLAQAQESLLGFDTTATRNSMQRAAKLLATQFDGDDAAVKAARAQIDGLLTTPAPGVAPQLGGALAQLRSVRASQPQPAPVPATSTGGAKP